MASFLQKSPVSLQFWARELVLWHLDKIHYRHAEDFDEVADALRLLIEQKTILTKWDTLSCCLKEILELMENPYSYVPENETGQFAEEIVSQIRQISNQIAQYTPAERNRFILISKTQ